VPSPWRPSALVPRQELTFPGEPGVGRKTVVLFLLFCTLFPGIGAGARPGADKVHELRAHAFCLHSSLPELSRDPGGQRLRA